MPVWLRAVVEMKVAVQSNRSGGSTPGGGKGADCGTPGAAEGVPEGGAAAEVAAAVREMMDVVVRKTDGGEGLVGLAGSGGGGDCVI